MIYTGITGNLFELVRNQEVFKIKRQICFLICTGTNKALRKMTVSAMTSKPNFISYTKTRLI